MKELLAKVILGWIVTMLILYCIILPDSVNPFLGEDQQTPLEELINDPGLMVHPDSIGLTDDSKRMLWFYFDSVSTEMSYTDTADFILFDPEPYVDEARLDTLGILTIYNPNIIVKWDTIGWRIKNK